jgi:hypothetical protein
MNPEIVPSKSGLPTLKYGDEFLEDRTNPVEGANAFVTADAIKKATYVIVFGLGLGYRLARIKELGVKSLLVYEPSMEVLELAKAHAPERLEGVRVFTDPNVAASFIGDRTEPEETFTLLAPPPYQRAFADEYKLLVRVLGEAQGITVLRRNTIRERSAALVESALRNLPRIANHPLALGLGKPLKGSAAFIVSAGPSLDKNVGLLEEARKKGAIFALNTSAPVLAKRNIPIDVLVAIEALDVSPNLVAAAGVTKLAAIDLGVHEALFDTPIDKKLVFVSAASQFAPIARGLDTQSLTYGGSVATAAFALAYAWGADPIILIGQDLAYTDMRCYAKGTPYDDMLARVEGSHLVFEGAPIKEEIYNAGGIKPQPRRKSWIRVPAWGGEGEVHTTHELLSFKRWFDATAWYFKGERRFVNATEGGVRIENFEEKTLREMIDSLPDATADLEASYASAVPLSASLVSSLRERIGRSAKKVVEAVQRVVSEKSQTKRAQALEALRGVAKEAPLVNSHSATALLRLREEKDVSMIERERRTFAAIRDSARKVLSLVS